MERRKLRILGIPGSTKSRSTSLAVLEFVRETFQEDIVLDIYESLGSLPHFNPDLDHTEPPQAVRDIRKLVEQADGVLFCTPEYVFSMPGSLKNLLEWHVSTTIFSGKPVGMIVAAASGDRAFASLSLVLTTIEAILPEGAKLQIRGARGKVHDGGVIEDPELRQRISAVVQALMETISNPEKRPTKYDD